MEDFKLEYTKPDVVYETVNTKPQEPQYRYYEIEVSRKQVAWVTVRVPDDIKLNLSNSHDIAEKAVKALVKDYDWDTDLPVDIEVEGYKLISEEEALEYDVYEAPIQQKFNQA